MDLVEDPRAAGARAAAEAGRWERAATLWEALAGDIQDEDGGAAVQALSLAADAWLREDRPLAAVGALRRAMIAVGNGPGAALLQVQLAAALADAGQLGPALEACRAVVETQEGGAGERELALDVACGLALERGELALATDLVDRLTDPRARAFRAATVLRVVGRSARASAALSVAFDAVGDHPALGGLRAALLHEEGEQALINGQPDDALDAFASARAGWAEVRRRSGMFHAIAGEVRARLARGELPLTAELDRGVDYAGDRGLVILETDLRTTRAATRARAGLRGVAEDLGRAVELAAQSGAALAEGRARQQRMVLGCAEPGDADAVERLLAGTCWA
ncbi:MAG: hypothetical protein D6798_00335 [Deltaproteobacteria bacterium]|nr:MAG: hypothetical protein D6798_00335 [Deltaproteobacteria bacterium]